MAVARLSRTLAHYSWGGHGAISDLFGWSPTTEPEAEWWLGVHPIRPSTLAADKTPLAQWLQRHEASADLPYLFKVLAPTMPLSLQVHPTTEQAQAGFESEVEAGIALDAPERLYRDRHAKPELVVALEGGFDALAGVRPVAESVAELSRINQAEPSEPIQDFMARLTQSGVDNTVEWLLAGETDVDAVLADLCHRGSRSDTLSRLCEHFPGDPGIAIALLLHRVTLQHGEALFVDAGVPHAYLEGYAVELMAPSDNVLRGGLTTKHVDRDAFVEIANLGPSSVPRLDPTGSGDVWCYEPPGQGFCLWRLAGPSRRVTVELAGPSIVLCTAGQWQLRGPRGSVAANRGEAWAVSQSESPVTFDGSGELWWASPR